MAENIANLDALIPQDRKFKLNGKIFVVPGEMTVKQVLNINRIVQSMEQRPEASLEAIGAIWETIASSNKGIKKEDFTETITASMLAPLLRVIFQQQEDPPAEISGDKPEVFDNSKNESGR